MVHELKLDPQYFDAIDSNRKTFEIRLNDRDYKIGDTLRLNEWDEQTGYSGRWLKREVTYILRGGLLGLGEGFVIMSIQ
jgi:ASC-1-like (ASCH) protein